MSVILWVAGGFVGLAGLALLGAGSDTPEPGPEPTPDPTPEPGGNRATLQAYLDAAEQISGIQGLALYGMIVASRESNYSPTALNDSAKEAAKACEGWNRDGNRNGRYSQSQYQSESDWCWGSGGWFGFLPSTALAPSGFHDFNPHTVRSAAHKPEQVAYFAAMVRAIIANYFPNLPPDCRNWLAIRRAWASLTLMYDCEEQSEHARSIRENFAESLGDATPAEADSFMFREPTAAGWPGNVQFLAAMRAWEKGNA